MDKQIDQVIQETVDKDKTDLIKQVVAAVREYDEKKRHKDRQARHDYKLRNTRLLLNHYNYFKEHIDESICSSDQMEVIDIIAELQDCRGSIDIQSIKKSARKTFVFMGHIDKMINLYQVLCDQEGEIGQRKFRVLKMFYIDRIKIPDILQAEFISEKTYYRDINSAINTLSTLIFGIDAVQRMTE